jgi:predicted transcriptional regulator
MAKKKIPLELGKRERQIVETVVKLGEASVAEVRSNLADAPSYSAVRAMLNVLVEKKWLKFRREGKRHLYRPSATREKSQRTAVTRMMDTFFGNSPSEVLAALLDSSAAEMTDAELKRMQQMIAKARKERK